MGRGGLRTYMYTYNHSYVAYLTYNYLVVWCSVMRERERERVRVHVTV